MINITIEPCGTSFVVKYRIKDFESSIKFIELVDAVRHAGSLSKVSKWWLSLLI